MNFDWKTESLPTLAELLWARLQVACTPGDPWRLPVLATVCDPGGASPDARVVVLRSVDGDEGRILAFSDSRAPKVGQLRRNGAAVWVFYDPRDSAQLRLRSEVVIHERDGFAHSAWEGVPSGNRQNYRTVRPPGGPIESPDLGWEGSSPELPANFAVIEARILEADWLWLNPEGHRRARFIRHGKDWVGSWLTP
jgi:hypothetical protein